jgi:hypothetical protein
MVNRFSPSDQLPLVNERHHNHGVTFDRIWRKRRELGPGSPSMTLWVGEAHFIDSAEACTVAHVQFEQRQMQPAAMG